MIGDPLLKNCKEGDIIQLTRRGFFRVDRAYAPASEFSSVASPVILFEIPDGSTKDKPTSGQPKKAAAPVTNEVSTIYSNFPKPAIHFQLSNIIITSSNDLIEPQVYMLWAQILGS